TPQLLAQIADRPRRLVHIGLAAEPGRSGVHVIEELVDGRAFPALTSLGVWGYPEDWTWLWRTALGAQLERIEVAHQIGESPWLTATLPSHVREIRFRERANEARLVRDGSAFPRIEVLGRDPARDVVAWASLLEPVPRRTLREVRFVLPRRAKHETITRLEAATRRGHPDLTRFTLDVDPFV
ncbi:MAG TPA: hypothetical protein VK427_18025, partial [Kofleriaceae bacterium]|nr:hypothetical protein [Kofleriaceae bacterium]